MRGRGARGENSHAPQIGERGIDGPRNEARGAGGENTHAPPRDERGRDPRRNQRSGEHEDGNPLDDDDDAPPDRTDPNETWPPHAMTWFREVKDSISKAVKRRRVKEGTQFKSIFQGQFPLKYCGIIAPSEDPVSWFGTKKAVPVERFCLPNTFVWFPEAQWPDLQPGAKLPCKWHGTTDCVENQGWVRRPRHGYSSHRTIAIIGRCYKCNIKEKENADTSRFQSTDKEVICQLNDYVRTMWRRHGFDISHRAAIKIEMLDNLRSNLSQGLGVNPFRRSLLESHQRYYFDQSVLWRSYVDSLEMVLRAGSSVFINPTVVRQSRVDFPYFDSEMYHDSLPTNAYMIERVIKVIEEDADYSRRRMQMLDGEHLSGDHSFKIAKCILAGKSKTFTAMYSIMNEFGQIVAWWLTTGTGMEELRGSVEKLRQRYAIHGFSGVKSFTTDRCCQERAYWNSIFSFLDGFLEDGTIPEADLRTVNVVDMPYEKRHPAYTTQIALMYIGEIWDHLGSQPAEKKVIIFDAEWRLGHKRADVAIIKRLCS